ncbi:MAG: proprotein convertase P-domain-containing protein, partial [Candidatus Brocadiales bacterium]|nr:proprotein convertase P-domain-containing protein [Candidatus Brocadiales bacterium]
MRNKLILLFLFLSSLYGQTQTIYTGEEFSFSNSSNTITRKKLNVPDSGTITDINLKFSGSHTYTFRYTYIALVSPYGTHVALTTENTSSLNTDIVDRGIWDDEASKSMSDVSKPFNDSFRPDSLLSKFDGEEMKGDWELFIYQNNSGSGTFTEWELQITHDNSTPSDPPAAQPGTLYRKGGLVSYIDGVHREKLNITDGGTITDLNIMFVGNRSSVSLMKLISPYGTELVLSDNSCHNLSGVDYFVDDEAVQTDIPPCEIRYKNINAGNPDYELSKFDGEEMMGEWELYIYATDGRSFPDWGLQITYDDSKPKDPPSPPTNPATIYTGEEFSFSNSSNTITRKKLNVPDSGTITDINLKFSGSHTYTFRYTYIALVSPYGTHVALTTENTSSLNTDIVDRGIWDDEASKSMSDVSKPFNDSFRPDSLLSKFDGEEMKGDWELFIYQNNSGSGTFTEWELQITHDNSTPSDPPAAQPGTLYRKGGLVSYIDGVHREKLNITDGGTITDLNIMFVGNRSSVSLMKLISPYGTELVLSDNSCHNLSGVDYFVDDEAVQTDIPPCEIRYKNINAGNPDYELSKFDGEEMMGEWELYIYATDGRSFPDWGLEITFLSGAPKTYITSTENSPTNKSPIPIKVDFDKEVTGFIQSEVTLVNGSISNFTGSGKHYTFDLTPSEDGNITIDIASGVAKDTANFDNIAAKQFLIVSDQTKPIGGVVNDGTGEDIDVQSNNSTINANWTGFADGLTGIGSYDWSIGTSSGGVEVLDWTSSGNNAKASKTNLSLINGQTYYVSVRAVDRAKNISDVANSDGVKVDFTSPSAPTGVVTSSNDGFVLLYWTKNSESDIKNYKVYRSTNQDFVPAPYLLVFSGTATDENYKDEDVVYGTIYYYKITAIDLADNEGTPSTEVNGRSIDLKPPEVT